MVKENDAFREDVQEMIDTPGFWIAQDSRTPGLVVPMFSSGGKIFSMKIDNAMDPKGFLDTAIFTGPFNPEKQS